MIYWQTIYWKKKSLRNDKLINNELIDTSTAAFSLDYGLFILTSGTSDMSILAVDINTGQKAKNPCKQKK